MLQLTFNPGLTLTGFRTTRPRALKAWTFLGTAQISFCSSQTCFCAHPNPISSFLFVYDPKLQWPKFPLPSEKIKSQFPFNPIWPAPSTADGKFCSVGFVTCFCTSWCLTYSCYRQIWGWAHNTVPPSTRSMTLHSVANHFLFKQNSAALNTLFKTL